MRPLVRLFLLATALASSSCATTAGPPRLERKRMVVESVRYWRASSLLSNGARVVAFEVRDARSYDLTVSFDGGSSEDPAGKEGLAVVAALAADRAAPGRGGLRIEERLFAAGATSSTVPEFEFIDYGAHVRPDRLEVVLQILRDRLADPAAGLDDAAIEDVRESVARALEEHAGNAALLEERVRALALRGTRYARAAPTVETVRAVTPEDVRGFLRATLRPERLVLAVTGPGPAGETVGRVASALGAREEAAPTGSPPPDAPLPPKAKHAAPLKTETAPVANPVLWLAWPTPGLHEFGRGRALAGLVDSAVTGRATSRFEEEVSATQTRWIAYRDAGMVLTRIDLTDAKHAERVHEAMLREVASAGDDYGLVFAYMLRRFAGESTGDAVAIEWNRRSDVPAWLRATGEDDPVMGQRRALLEQVNDSFSPFARAHLAKGRAVALLVTPGAGARTPPLPKELVADEEPWTRIARNRLSASAPGASEVTRLLAGSGLGDVIRRRLSNGLEVALLPRGTLPIVQVQLVVRAGRDRLSAREEILALLAASSSGPAKRCRPPRWSADADALTLSQRGSPEALPYLLDAIACGTRVSPDRSRFRKVRDGFARAVAGNTGSLGRLAAERALYGTTAHDPAAIGRG
ncbi:MAG TPA: insulinase family protein, partial [Anaeromyxobacteraceae bacterium]|nr:insulinase family protein [Anaeromyxobacteraceae bacterium]